MFSMHVTLAIVFVAAQFYPTTEILSLWKNDDDRKQLIADKEYLIKRYYWRITYIMPHQLVTVCDAKQ